MQLKVKFHYDGERVCERNYDSEYQYDTDDYEKANYLLWDLEYAIDEFFEDAGGTEIVEGHDDYYEYCHSAYVQEILAPIYDLTTVDLECTAFKKHFASIFTFKSYLCKYFERDMEALCA